MVPREDRTRTRRFLLVFRGDYYFWGFSYFNDENSVCSLI